MSMRSDLLTGCDTELGVAVARQYAAGGFRVFATRVDPKAAEPTRAAVGDARVLAPDASDVTPHDTPSSSAAAGTRPAAFSLSTIRCCRGEGQVCVAG